MTRETLVRERSSHLLFRLIEDHLGECHADAVGALRLMSHASLNLASELGTDVVHRAGEALVWVALFAQWESGDMGAVALGRELVGRRLVACVPETMVQRRLEKVEALRVSTVLHRAPREAQPQIGQVGQKEADVLVALHRLDGELGRALACEDAELMDRLFSESMLLCAALELSVGDGVGAGVEKVAARLASLLGAVSAERIAALEILAEIENGGFEQVPAAFSQLSERSGRFELSLAQNMGHHGLLCVVRAALGFGGKSRELRLLEAFSGHNELADLALVLMEMRGRCLGYFSGALGIESLKPWVMYLRNGCMELAEARGLTLREAMGFAHYCLHLMNLCDLGGRGLRVVTEETRRALMDVEDDLKEFALSGQRGGVLDAQVDLAAFERGRWKRNGDSAYLVDRLARLTGGWRAGARPGPVGAPARLDGQVLVKSQALIDEIIVELSRTLPEGGEKKAVGMMAALLRNCEIRGAEFLETVALEDAFKVLSFGLAAARDLAGIDVSLPFCLDLRAFLRGAWHGADSQMLEQVLKRRSLDAFFSSSGEPTGRGGSGLVGRVMEGGVATLVVSFEMDAELAALLDLMNHSSSQSVRLRAMLEARLDELLDAGGEEELSGVERAGVERAGVVRASSEKAAYAAVSEVSERSAGAVRS